MSGSALAGTRFSPRARGRSARSLVALGGAAFTRRAPDAGARSASPLRAEPDMAGSGLGARGPYDESQGLEALPAGVLEVERPPLPST